MTLYAAATAKSRQSCPTLCDPIDGSPPGSRSWDSPGKNTGVGCHFLLQCMKVKSEREVAQSCLTLGDPTDCSLAGSSVHGISQARVLEWGAIAFSSFRVYITLLRFSIFLRIENKFAFSSLSMLIMIAFKLFIYFWLCWIFVAFFCTGFL